MRMQRRGAKRCFVFPIPDQNLPSTHNSANAHTQTHSGAALTIPFLISLATNRPIRVRKRARIGLAFTLVPQHLSNSTFHKLYAVNDSLFNFFPQQIATFSNICQFHNSPVDRMIL